MTTEELLPLPIGNSSFETLRDADQIYVDKTALVYELARKREKFFLTRPRRFGKSLLVSTFASLFSHGLKYFSGLAIEKLWIDKTYNVVEIDFSEIKNFTSLEDFESQFKTLLIDSFKEQGFVFQPTQEGDWLQQIAVWLKKLPLNSLVLLIDEYDSPQTAALDNKELFVAVRKRLASFYAKVKSNDGCLRFMFITGIAKFNQTGIFSEFNTFTDISLISTFGALLGYTEDDLDRYFSGYLAQAATVLKTSETEVRRQLRDHYDGFCFEETASQHVYAPWSVLNFLSWPFRGFFNYWMGSGGQSTALQKYLHTHAIRSPEDYGEEQTLRLEQLSASTDYDVLSDVVLLTQSGYFTIKRRNGRYLSVGFPNQEVSDTFAELYTDLLLKQQTFEDVGAGRLQEAVLTGNADLLFEAANHAFAAIDYQRYPIREEKHYQAYLQIFIFGGGFDVSPENHSALGRSDLEIRTQKFRWILELKYLKTGSGTAEALLQKAVAQMQDRRYGAASDRRLIRVAAVFSEEKRAFVRWQQVE